MCHPNHFAAASIRGPGQAQAQAGGVDDTRRRLLRAPAAGLLLAAFHALRPPGARAQGLPSLGGGGPMSLNEERRLGDLIAREIYRDPSHVEDWVLSAYVDDIWQQLLDGAQRRGELDEHMRQAFAWHVFLIRDSSINAFALPGGYLGVHLGLLGLVGSRDELASVLAHEISHVTQRHIARMLEQQSRQAPMLLAALVLGAIAAVGSPQAGAALATGGQAALIQQQLNYSRAMESEADRIGLAVLRESGFAPEGFAAMFERMQQASSIDDRGDWPYLRTHPLTTQRIADMRQRLHRVAPQDRPEDLVTALMAARARALSSPGVDALRRWADAPRAAGFAGQGRLRRGGARYAAAMAQAQLQDLSAARATAEQLEQDVSADAAANEQARLLQAELALRAGATAQALQWLPASAVASAEGQGRAQRLLRAQALTAAGQPGAARELLQPWVAQHPQDAAAWQLLAQAWQAQDQILRALRAEGEAQMARLDYAGAIDRWRAAQDWSRRNPVDAAGRIEASIVDTRLRTAREALEQQERDEKKWD